MKKKVTKKQKTITICSSASFYPEVILFRDKLNERGWKVFVPHSAALMERKGSFNVAAYKTWFSNPRHLKRKTWLMENHLRKIAMADSIFVVNLSKKGINGYVGGNGLIEMFYAHLKKKKIYMLNPISKQSPLREEVMGLRPVVVKGDLRKIRR